jgi:hypothetical protein
MMVRRRRRRKRRKRKICPMAFNRTPLFQPNDSAEIRHLRFYVILTVYHDTSV